MKNKQKNFVIYIYIYILHNLKLDKNHMGGEGGHIAPPLAEEHLMAVGKGTVSSV